MSKTIEFSVPTRSGVKDTRKGRVAHFDVGGRKVKFVLQQGGFLTHYASGYKFGSLKDMRIELMCLFSPYRRFSEHRVAEHLIEKAIVRRGISEVLRVLDDAPVING